VVSSTWGIQVTPSTCSERPSTFRDGKVSRSPESLRFSPNSVTDGEAFIFENGTFVTWNVQKDGIAQLLSQIIQAPGVSPKAYAKPQEETLPYAFDENA
jgi:uncharacterized Rmd1/YagE family protein